MVDAAVNTAIAGSVAAARRANGECLTPCTPGTTCNQATGLCDPIPCRGECKLGDVCEVTGLGEKCVPQVGAIDSVLSVHSASAPHDAGVSDVPTNPQRLELPR